MRKWICVGILGGLLEFGIVYQVAFSDTDPPAQETLRAAETNGSKTPAKRAGRTSRRSPRHIAAAAGIAGQTTPADPPAETNTLTGPAKTSPPAAPPAAGSTAPSGHAGASTPPAADDPLTATLKAAASAVASLPMNLGLDTPANGALVPGLPAAVPGLLPPGGVEELAKVLPLPAPAPSPSPVDLSKLPVEELIRHVFGAAGEKAVAVARCESEMRTHAKKGQFLGLFQLGANERADYGHGPDALAQVLAAHELFLDRGWQPWTCA